MFAPPSRKLLMSKVVKAAAEQIKLLSQNPASNRQALTSIGASLISEAKRRGYTFIKYAFNVPIDNRLYSSVAIALNPKKLISPSCLHMEKADCWVIGDRWPVRSHDRETILSDYINDFNTVKIDLANFDLDDDDDDEFSNSHSPQRAVFAIHNYISADMTHSMMLRLAYVLEGVATFRAIC